MRAAFRFSIRPRVAMILIAAVAFLVRLLHVLSYDPEPTNDMAVYVEIAVKRLALANVFSEAGICWFPPGYPLFLKPFFLLLGPQAALRAAQIGQALLGAWTCILVGRIARRTHSRRAGLAAALAACFFPHFLFYSSAFMSENVFIPLFYATLLLFLRAVERPGGRRHYLAGIVAGAATLVRPAAVSLAPAALAVCWSASRDWRGRLRALVLVLLGGLTLIAPWAARNWIAYGRLVLLAPNGAFNLAVGNHADATGTYTDPPSISGDFWDRTEYFRQQAIDFVTNDPWGALFVVARLKWQSFWDLVPPWPLYSSNPSLFYGDFFFPYLSWRLVFFLGCVGVGVLLARRRPWAWLTPACLLAYTAFYMLYFGNPRIRFPSEGFFLVWTGVTVAGVVSLPVRTRSSRAPRWGAWIGILLVAVLAEAGLSAARTRAGLRSEGSLVAAGDQVIAVPSGPPSPILGREAILLEPSRGRYLRMGFTAFRQGPHRDAPTNGMVQIVYLDRAGRSVNWLDNSAYFLEALPADRWVTVRFKSKIPPNAASCRVMLTPEPGSPDVLILDQPILRYAGGNDLALEFLYPYLRYEE